MLEIFQVIYPIFGIIFLGFLAVYLKLTAKDQLNALTPAVKHGIKYLVDFIRQPDGKILGILEQAI